MAKFQMVGSENPNTIAEVFSVVDIDSFRKDQNWYEIVKNEEIKTIKVAKQTKATKEEK